MIAMNLRTMSAQKIVKKKQKMGFVFGAFLHKTEEMIL